MSRFRHKDGTNGQIVPALFCANWIFTSQGPGRDSLSPLPGDLNGFVSAGKIAIEMQNWNYTQHWFHSRFYIFKENSTFQRYSCITCDPSPRIRVRYCQVTTLWSHSRPDQSPRWDPTWLHLPPLILWPIHEDRRTSDVECADPHTPAVYIASEVNTQPLLDSDIMMSRNTGCQPSVTDADIIKAKGALSTNAFNII